MNATKFEPSEQQKANWAAADEAALARKAEEQRVRDTHDALVRADKTKAAAAAAAKSEVASGAALIREARRDALVVQIAELELVVEAIDEASMARHGAMLSGQYDRNAPRLSVGEDGEARMRQHLSSLRSELATIDLVGKAVQHITAARSKVASLPKRRELSTKIQNVDDVMIVIGSSFDDREREELWSDEDGTAVGVANTVRGSSSFIVFIPKTEWESVDAKKGAKKGAKFFEARRTRLVAMACQRSSVGQRDPSTATSAQEFESLKAGRAALEKNEAERYEREHVLVLEGDVRWDLAAIYERLQGKVSESENGPVRGQRLATLAMNLTRDDRTLVKWLAKLKAQVAPGTRSEEHDISSALFARMVDGRLSMGSYVPGPGDHVPHIEAAQQWWKTARAKKAEATDETKAVTDGAA